MLWYILWSKNSRLSSHKCSFWWKGGRYNCRWCKDDVVLMESGRGPKIFTHALRAATTLLQLKFNPSYALERVSFVVNYQAFLHVLSILTSILRITPLTFNWSPVAIHLHCYNYWLYILYTLHCICSVGAASSGDIDVLLGHPDYT